MASKVCQHPVCKNYAKDTFCYGHLSLIQNEVNSVLLCLNCGSLVAVFNREIFLNKPTSVTDGINSKKYYWSRSCRKCNLTDPDEKVLRGE